MGESRGGGEEGVGNVGGKGVGEEGGGRRNWEGEVRIRRRGGGVVPYSLYLMTSAVAHSDMHLHYVPRAV